MDIWKDFSIADAIVAVDKAITAIKLATVITCWNSDAAPGSAPPKAEPIKEVMEEIVSLEMKEEQTEDDLLEMTGAETFPGNEDEDLEEAMPENKLILENLVKGF
ncbi:Podospora anserina S mat+ genomic DNA chromosome 4, supercontig 4 [Trichuris trichiura]|uniref:Podospora anserina S mat+ genomic DNA chromosome 4, supercontig 4 n=1 Tax=Trichuris trichiura TaxID=36087 RepID=A0A077ZMW5_TRITR|nr:Podospora anserina S mat+ genomic DNA chromosome 4, supercontig 4 [Trichuris trichiura]